LIKEPKLCKATAPNSSHDNGAGLVINDLEAQRLIFVALTNLLSQPGRSIPSATYIEILKVTSFFLNREGFLQIRSFLLNNTYPI
jgi:hypothetical protein